jgi:outer membrane protein assembly factor BamA
MKYILFICLVILYTTLCAEDEEQKKSVSYFDANDSMLDLSEHLSQIYGFIPIPIIITEPAIGYGGGATLFYLHDTFMGKKGKSGKNIPPSISGVIAAATQNGTWIAGAFHLGYYLEDTLRTQTFIGYPDVNIDFYTNSNRAVSMNISGPLAYQSLKFRISDSNLFLGVGLSYTKITNKLKTELIPGIPQSSFKNVGAHLLIDYDTRDNTLSPNEGMIFNANMARFDKALGSHYSYERYIFQELLYIPLNERFNFDQRLYYSQVGGDEAPFFMYPFINMRGVPVMKYQGEKTALYEAQLRWTFRPRWSLLGFVGLAKAYGKDKFFPDTINTPFKEAKTVISKGVGFRYLIAKKFGLRVGVDVAATDEDSAFYLKFGTAWIGL